MYFLVGDNKIYFFVFFVTVVLCEGFMINLRAFSGIDDSEWKYWLRRLKTLLQQFTYLVIYNVY